jgi:hypothetical protein
MNHLLHLLWDIDIPALSDLLLDFDLQPHLFLRCL